MDEGYQRTSMVIKAETWRRLKVEAANRGVKLQDLVSELLEGGLYR